MTYQQQQSAEASVLRLRTTSNDHYSLQLLFTYLGNKHNGKSIKIKYKYKGHTFYIIVMEFTDTTMEIHWYDNGISSLYHGKLLNTTYNGIQEYLSHIQEIRNKVSTLLQTV